MEFRVPRSEIPTKQKITGFLAHSTCRPLTNLRLVNGVDNSELGN